MRKKALFYCVRNLKACIELMLIFCGISLSIANLIAHLPPAHYQEFKSLSPYLNPSPTQFCIYMLAWSGICYWFVMKAFKILKKRKPTGIR